MSDEKINGDFEYALIEMIERLKRAKGCTNSSLVRFASDVLANWDGKRGNDWFTSTRKRESKNE